MKTFLKANAASLGASFCDYLVTIISKQFLHIDEVVASVMGTVVGGVVNFLIGRHWVFRSMTASYFQQGKKYFLAWTGNLFLNAFGVYVLTKHAAVHYIIAKVMTSLSVAIGYNYPIQKKYVFKNTDMEERS